MYVNIRQNAWSIVGTQEILESTMSIAVNFDHINCSIVLEVTVCLSDISCL